MAEAFVGLGGNVGDVRATFARAIELFCDGEQVRLAARSSDYLTEPWGVTDQPPFVNAVIRVETSLTPRQLLARAQQVEHALGRDHAHERHWGPRAIDIDILAYDDITLDEPELVLPHPYLLERAFVLVPLAEIAASRNIAGIRVSDALRRLDQSGIERLPPRSHA